MKRVFVDSGGLFALLAQEDNRADVALGRAGACGLLLGTGVGL